MAPSVSIITPSFNQGRFIERTIQSVLAQGVPDLEYLVLDGGSTDETVGILKRYESRLWWVSEKDGGQADAVNKGIRQSSGEIIGWLNSDDIYYPGAVRAVCDFLAAHPEVDAVYGDGNHINENDAFIEPYPTEQWNPERLADVCFICQPTVFLRRRAVNRFGLLDPQLRFCMDYEYWVRLGTRGARIARIPTLLAGSRLYQQNKTLGSRIQCHKEINSMLRRRLGRTPDRWLFNYAHAAVDDLGVPRGSFRFAVLVSLYSWLASLRWNQGISRNIAHTTSQWVAGGWKGPREQAVHANRV